MSNPSSTISEHMSSTQAFESEVPLGFTLGEKGKRVYFSIMRTPKEDHFLAVDFYGNVFRKVRGKDVMNYLRVK